MASVKKQAFVDMQGDGNVCVYKGSDPSHNAGLIWCSGTKQAGAELVMQGDGNLCARVNQSESWCSGSSVPSCTNCPFFARVSDVGRGICVYKGSPESPPADPHWCSKLDPAGPKP